MIISDSIIYEDNHLLIVNKASGILSQKDKTGDDSILEIGKAYIKEKYGKPGDVFLGLPHRLDRPVSGIMVLCRTSKSLTRMTAIIKERKISKIYNCITRGKAKEPSKVVKSYIRKDTRRNKATVQSKEFKGAKDASLAYNVLAVNNNKTLLEVELHTGRPHQIRAQLSFIGMPILGDKKYNGGKPLPDKSIGLHAYNLKFEHPVGGEPLDLKARWPKKYWWDQFL